MSQVTVYYHSTTHVWIGCLLSPSSRAELVPSSRLWYQKAATQRAVTTADAAAVLVLSRIRLHTLSHLRLCPLSSLQGWAGSLLPFVSDQQAATQKAVMAAEDARVERAVAAATMEKLLEENARLVAQVGWLLHHGGGHCTCVIPLVRSCTCYLNPMRNSADSARLTVLQW